MCRIPDPLFKYSTVGALYFLISLTMYFMKQFCFIWIMLYACMIQTIKHYCCCPGSTIQETGHDLLCLLVSSIVTCQCFALEKQLRAFRAKFMNCWVGLTDNHTHCVKKKGFYFLSYLWYSCVDTHDSHSMEHGHQSAYLWKKGVWNQL